MNPPSREWVTKVIKYLEKWSEIAIDTNKECDIMVDVDCIAPHAVDKNIGDGHCLFRAISKAVTGTQKNHAAVRKAVVQWMLCGDHPPELAKYIGSYDQSTAVSRDTSLVVKNYVEKSGMSQCAWGSDKEIRALATMFQIDIYVSNNSPGGRRWNTFSPLFRENMNCVEKSCYKLYLYHSDSGNHYDRVIPSAE